MNNRQLFLQHVAQTSDAPLALEMKEAKGMYIYGVDGKEYLDMIAGISVCNVGHCHPDVVKAIQGQAASYMHLIVYGEFIQSPQVAYATYLSNLLPNPLNCVYFTNSGSEATEGAMKLAKRYTGRHEIIAFKNSYHGSTQGSLSIMGDEYWRNAYRPLLPGIHHLDYNAFEALEAINHKTACVIAESVQAEAGVKAPSKDWMQALRKRCDETGTLLILDEIQCGFGRNGTLWAFEQYGIVPDVLLLGKALGAGMPMGAFIADKEIMWSLTNQPVLGHITTFGGHPVACAAGLAGAKALIEGKYIDAVNSKKELLLKHLKHPAIKDIRAVGLMVAVEFESFDLNKKVIDQCIADGLITDWFLFAANCLRLVPPLIISEDEIMKACSIITKAIDKVLTP